MIEEIKKAKELEIVGFTDEGYVVTQVDGDRCVQDRPDSHRRIYTIVGKGEPEKKESSGEKPKTREYMTAAGMETFDISREACEPLGFSPGDRVDSPYGPGTVIGENGGYLWIDYDKWDGQAYREDYTTKAEYEMHGYRLISSAEEGGGETQETGERKGGLRKFTGLRGMEIIATPDETLEEFTVGEKLELTPEGRKALRPEISSAVGDFHVAGFTEDKKVIVQLDGGICTVNTLDVCREWYTPTGRTGSFGEMLKKAMGAGAESKEALPGRDPEKFLMEEFADNPDEMSWWSWEVSSDGRLVHMRSTLRPSGKYIDEKREVVFHGGVSGSGISKLLEKLKSKKILSVKDKNNHWYLEVLD